MKNAIYNLTFSKSGCLIFILVGRKTVEEAKKSGVKVNLDIYALMNKMVLRRVEY